PLSVHGALPIYRHQVRVHGPGGAAGPAVAFGTPVERWVAARRQPARPGRAGSGRAGGEARQGERRTARYATGFADGPERADGVQLGDRGEGADAVLVRLVGYGLRGLVTGRGRGAGVGHGRVVASRRPLRRGGAASSRVAAVVVLTVRRRRFDVPRALPAWTGDRVLGVSPSCSSGSAQPSPDRSTVGCGRARRGRP